MGSRPPIHPLHHGKHRERSPESDRPGAIAAFTQRDVRQGPKIEGLHRARKEPRSDNNSFVRNAIHRPISLSPIDKEPTADHIKSNEHKRQTEQRKNEIDKTGSRTLRTRPKHTRSADHPKHSKSTPKDAERDEKQIKGSEKKTSLRMACPQKDLPRVHFTHQFGLGIKLHVFFVSRPRTNHQVPARLAGRDSGTIFASE